MTSSYAFLERQCVELGHGLRLRERLLTVAITERDGEPIVLTPAKDHEASLLRLKVVRDPVTQVVTASVDHRYPVVDSPYGPEGSP